VPQELREHLVLWVTKGFRAQVDYKALQELKVHLVYLLQVLKVFREQVA
jgi:hypothetical protein